MEIIEIEEIVATVAKEARPCGVSYADAHGSIEIEFDEVLPLEDHPALYSGVLSALSSDYRKLIKETWDFGLGRPVVFAHLYECQNPFLTASPSIVIAIENGGIEHAIALFKHRGQYVAVPGTSAQIARFVNPVINQAYGLKKPAKLFEMISNVGDFRLSENTLTCIATGEAEATLPFCVSSYYENELFNSEYDRASTARWSEKPNEIFTHSPEFIFQMSADDEEIEGEDASWFQR